MLKYAFSFLYLPFLLLLLSLQWLVEFGLEQLFECKVGLLGVVVALGRLHLNCQMCCISVWLIISVHAQVRRRPNWNSHQFQKSSASSSRLRAFVISISPILCQDRFSNLEYRWPAHPFEFRFFCCWAASWSSAPFPLLSSVLPYRFVNLAEKGL